MKQKSWFCDNYINRVPSNTSQIKYCSMLKLSIVHHYYLHISYLVVRTRGVTQNCVHWERNNYIHSDGRMQRHGETDWNARKKTWKPTGTDEIWNRTWTQWAYATVAENVTQRTCSIRHTERTLHTGAPRALQFNHQNQIDRLCLY
jgi:hypothetical protein